METFRQFFKQATHSSEPYPYQERFASADTLPDLLNVPTGAGKTATAILGWLWHRNIRPQGGVPRRLVYCLPMRVLVEQTFQEATNWLKNLDLGEQVGLHLLMGGEEREQWFLHADKPAILIGTQDMLLSRALNRGYGENRFHWPIDFGLLNNDCLWVFDEPQLMDNGLTTSAQLAGLRKALGGFGKCQSLWMSATLEPTWLNTVDFLGCPKGEPLELDVKDFDPKRALLKRMTAHKTLHRLEAASSTDMKEVAKAVLEKHQADSQTIVVVNVVERAKALFKAIQNISKKSATSKLLLVHSRFRPHERAQLNKELQQKDAGDRIIVATQVVEAGVDVSARTLITELAPWPSVVQRIGRCNRTGDDGDAQVFWIDIEDKLAPPYEIPNLELARKHLQKLDAEDVSPQSLTEFKSRENVVLPFEHKHVLRRRDLLSLFDTSPDLSGNDIDIARFIRSDDPDSDVQVFWRDWPGSSPPAEEPRPARIELCSVPIKSAKDFLDANAKKHASGYAWDHLDERWGKVDSKQVRPGMVILLHCSTGGYSELGWDIGSTTAVTSLKPADAQCEASAASDFNTTEPLPSPLSIAEHTQHVCDEMTLLIDAVKSLTEFGTRLSKAARWHDAGKAHHAFQAGLRKVNSSLDPNTLWAKTGKRGKLVYGDRRRYFRHELVSALAALQQGIPFDVAYLIAAHHGKVRLSIRSLPGEEPPENGRMFALGVHDGDVLPEVEMGGETCAKTTLDLSIMQLGGEASWTGRALDLLSELGPFKLAYLEAILRIADVRATRKEAGHE